MSTTSFSHSSRSRASLHGPALIPGAIVAAVVIAAIVVAITLSTSGSSTSPNVDRVTASQAATYARELATQPGTVRTNSRSTPLASNPTASKPAGDLAEPGIARFSPPGPAR